MNDQANSGFPISVDHVVATMTEFFRGQGNYLACEILESAKAKIEETGYDNWNGGQYIFTLRLELPMKVFARIESEVPNMEKLISEKAAKVLPDFGNTFLQNVSIKAMLENPAKVAAMRVAPAEVEHLWRPGMFRLFLSHVATEKAAVSKLKSALMQLGVDSFVAHEDIEPTRDWQNEIDLALKSMQALAALLTPTFHESMWTDQEVGFALGKGTFVISVRLGLDPYGFIGKQQGLTGKLDAPDLLASSIVDLLLKKKATTHAMSDALIVGLEKSKSFPTSVAISKKLATLEHLSSDQLQRIEATCINNSKVKGAYYVPERIQGIIQRFTPATK